MLGAGLAHPEPREGLPLAPEPLLHAAGARKHAGARPVAQRLLWDGRCGPPPLQRLVVEEAWASHGSPIRLVRELDRRFGLGGRATRRSGFMGGGAAGLAPQGGETKGENGGRQR